MGLVALRCARLRGQTWLKKQIGGEGKKTLGLRRVRRKMWGHAYGIGEKYSLFPGNQQPRTTEGKGNKVHQWGGVEKTRGTLKEKAERLKIIVA